MTSSRWSVSAIHRDRVIPPLLAFVAFIAVWQLLLTATAHNAAE